jgi:hypothetical protein
VESFSLDLADVLQKNLAIIPMLLLEHLPFAKPWQTSTAIVPLDHRQACYWHLRFRQFQKVFRLVAFVQELLIESEETTSTAVHAIFEPTCFIKHSCHFYQTRFLADMHCVSLRAFG